MRRAADGSLVLTLPEAFVIIVALLLLVVWLFLINVKLGLGVAVFLALFLSEYLNVKRHVD